MIDLKDRIVRLRAYGKINLTLDILGTLSNGYHEVEMIMQQVSIYDSIAMRQNDAGGIVISSNCRWLPADERNLAWKAVKAFSNEIGKDIDVRIDMRKFIPVSAGMAGGSSDAAAVLKGLNRLMNTRFDDEKLMTIGAQVGSDVPFCIMGGTALAKGRGEVLSRLCPMPHCHILLAKPRLNVSTPVAYSKYDSATDIRRPDTAKCIEALKNGDIRMLAQNMRNVFEDVLKLEEVENLKRLMMSHGAVTAAMSGSGPTVFGIFEREEDVLRASKACGELVPFTFCCTPI